MGKKSRVSNSQFLYLDALRSYSSCYKRLSLSHSNRLVSYMLVCLYFLARLAVYQDPEALKSRSFRTHTYGMRIENMKKFNLVSEGARVKAEADNRGIFIHVELLNASVHDQNLFHGAIKELLSPIENPRYLLIPRKRGGDYRYRYALACPEVLGTRSEYAEYLAKELNRSIRNMAIVFTRTEQGRKLILTCRKASYITYNDNVLYGRRKHISRWE